MNENTLLHGHPGVIVTLTDLCNLFVIKHLGDINLRGIRFSFTRFLHDQISPFFDLHDFSESVQPLFIGLQELTGRNKSPFLDFQNIYKVKSVFLFQHIAFYRVKLVSLFSRYRLFTG